MRLLISTLSLSLFVRCSESGGEDGLWSDLSRATVPTTNKCAFKNYFKAGNCVQTGNPEGNVSFKYYNLTIQH